MAYKIDPVIDININNLFFQLHQTALQEVKKSTSAIDVVNLGVDYDKQSFIGAGDFIIVAQHKKNDTSVSPKNEPDVFFEQCKDALCVYMKNFAGTDVSEKLKDNKDSFIRLDDPAPVPESIVTLSLSELLFEKAEKTKTSGIGYYVEYTIQIPGQKKYQWYDIRDRFEKFLGKGVFSAVKGITKAATSVLGGILKDFQNVHINIGGKQYNIGQPVANALKKVSNGTKEFVTIAGQKFKKMFGKTDLKELDKNFSTELRNEFPNTTANSTIYKVDTLLIKLRKAKKLTSKILDKLMANGKVWRMENVITLQVSTNDENYEQFDIDDLYKCFTNALKNTKSMSGLRDVTTGMFNTFSKDNIIKIEDYSTALGVSKLRKQSQSIESMQFKTQFMNIVLENTILDEDDETDNAKTIFKKWALADDASIVDSSRINRLARNIELLKADDFKIVKTAEYKTKDKFINAVKAINTVDALNQFIDKLDAAGVIVQFVEMFKTLFQPNNKNSSANSTAEQKDLYIFCLSNVERQIDKATNKKDK